MLDTVTRLAPADVKRAVPALYPAAVALAQVAGTTSLELELVELVNLRVSQLNGCAYCVQLHTTSGREIGIAEAKLTLVVTWREAGVFSPREEAALAWAEELTLIAERHVPDAAYAAARAAFTDEELVGLTAVICAINTWNRISVPFRYAPEL